MKNYTTEQLIKMLEEQRQTKDFSDAGWEKLFSIERELASRGALRYATYNED